MNTKEFEALSKQYSDVKKIQELSGYSRSQVYYKLRQLKHAHNHNHNPDTPDTPASESEELIDLSSFVPTALSSFIARDCYSMLDVCYNSQMLIPVLVGEAGCGKTESVKQFAANKQLPFLRISFSESSNADELFGSLTIRSGSIHFQKSLLNHFLRNASIVLFDEVNAMLPEHTFLLHQLFDSRSIYIRQANEVLQVDDKCFIALAMNPAGRQYLGAKKLNHAFVDRLTVINVEPLSINELKQLYANAFNSSDESNQIFSFFADLRKLANDNGFALSVRALQKYLALRKSMSIGDSIQIAFLNYISLVKDIDVMQAGRTLAKTHVKGS